MQENRHTIGTANEKMVRDPFPIKKTGHYYERMGWIYFAHDGHAIKIGFSATPESRVRDLQGSSSRKIEFLWKIPGNLLDEQELHRKFAHLRLQGEWFQPDRELKDFIEGLKPKEPEPLPVVKRASDDALDFMRLAVFRPNVALKVATNPMLRCALQSYILNRGKEAEVHALKALDIAVGT